ncbi:MAG: hypothetical protein AAFR61_04045 [Bacteroidota bacterium]
MKEVLFSLLIFLFVLQACDGPTASPGDSPKYGDEVLTSRSTYLEARDALVKADQAAYQSGNLKLSPIEQALNEKLVALRKRENDAYKAAHDFPPANHFYRAKSKIEASPLFSFFRAMPKGALLHVHPPAMGSADWIAEQVLEADDCYVSWEGFDETHVRGEIRFFKEGEAAAGFVPARQLQQQLPALRDSIVHWLTFDEWVTAPAVDHWKVFEERFQRLAGFVFYAPMIKAFYRHAFESMVATGIQHVELRKTYVFTPYDLEHEPGYFNPDSSIRWFQEVVAEVQEKSPHFSANLIYTSLRFFDAATIRKELVQAFELKQKYPEVIRGFDLVAEEDAGRATQYFLDVWLSLDSLEKEYGVEMPFFMHGGESDWTSLDNLYDLSLLPVKRIGHGFNLIRFPSLVDEIIEKDICLEISPLSNQILGYVRDLRIHPGSYCLAQGVPISISSDDPLIFNYDGLAYDFWSVFMAWELDLPKLKQLVKNSLTYSALPSEAKASALAYWEKEWAAFVTAANENLPIIP